MFEVRFLDLWDRPGDVGQSRSQSPITTKTSKIRLGARRLSSSLPSGRRRGRAPTPGRLGLTDMRASYDQPRCLSMLFLNAPRRMDRTRSRRERVCNAWASFALEAGRVTYRPVMHVLLAARQPLTETKPWAVLKVHGSPYARYGHTPLTARVSRHHLLNRNLVQMADVSRWPHQRRHCESTVGFAHSWLSPCWRVGLDVKLSSSWSRNSAHGVNSGRRRPSPIHPGTSACPLRQTTTSPDD